MRELFRYVEPAEKNNATYGQEIRHLLILACTEVEAAWRGVLLDNDRALKGDDRLSTKDYVRLAAPMRLREWRVRLRDFSGYPEFAPFADWSDSNPTQSLPWFQAYNSAKHSREAFFEEATLEHALDALAPVFVLVTAQFGSWSERGEYLDIRVLQGFNAREVTAVQDFTVVTLPEWSTEELYVPPRVLGKSDWEPVPLFQPEARG